MQTRLLDPPSFLATIAHPLRRLTTVGRDEVEIWPYVEAIPAAELARFPIEGNDVERVHRSRDDRHDHVLIPTTTPPVYLVVVVDRAANAVVGHHVLNVTADLYGLPEPQPT